VPEDFVYFIQEINLDSSKLYELPIFACPTIKHSSSGLVSGKCNNLLEASNFVLKNKIDECIGAKRTMGFIF
jgi:hypothetical protein